MLDLFRTRDVIMGEGGGGGGEGDCGSQLGSDSLACLAPKRRVCWQLPG